MATILIEKDTFSEVSVTRTQKDPKGSKSHKRPQRATNGHKRPQRLEYACQRKSQDSKTETFRKHFGSLPLALANMWHNMTATYISEARVDIKEQDDAGFRMFLVAHFFLWTYPKNSGLIVSRFQICDKYSRGEHLWKWIWKIAALKALKIIWDPHLDSVESKIFVVTVDGMDFRVNEKKHPRFNQDKGQCSKKFNHCAPAKYEVAVSVFRSKIVWTNGPFRGAEHDLTMIPLVQCNQILNLRRLLSKSFGLCGLSLLQQHNIPCDCICSCVAISIVSLMQIAPYTIEHGRVWLP